MNAERVYNSAWLNPWLTLVAASLTLALVLRRQRFFTAWTVLALVDIALDGYLTGALSPFAPATLGTVAVPFVIAGDLRVFALTERFTQAADPREPTPPSALLRALALSLIVPVLAFGGFRLAAPPHTPIRWLFLVYEVLFALVGGVYLARLGRRAGTAPPRTHRWARGALRYALATYALWIVADVLLLAGQPGALWLRIVPNVAYYAGFVPFVWLTAPDEVRA